MKQYDKESEWGCSLDVWTASLNCNYSFRYEYKPLLNYREMELQLSIQKNQFKCYWITVGDKDAFWNAVLGDFPPHITDKNKNRMTYF